MPAEKRDAANKLRERLTQAQIDFDEITGSPKRISAAHGFLTGPNGIGGAVSEKSLRGFRADDSNRATKAFLKEHKLLFGHGPEVLAAARVKREHTTPHNGLRTVIWEQQLDGIAVFEAVLLSHSTKHGELVSVSSQFVPDAVSAANKGHRNRARQRDEPRLSAAEAILKAGENVGETLQPADIQAQTQAQGAERKQKFKAKNLRGDTTANLVWLPMSATEMRLCWEVILTSRSRGVMFRVLIDAESGQALVRHCLTNHISDATYRVFTGDSPSPFSPAHPAPSTLQPPIVARQLVTMSALSSNASPNGWINDGANETRGNNVDAHSDRNSDDEADLPRPQGAPFRVFDFPLDLASHPTNYTKAAIVQLFYWCNWMHDQLYELGFTEAAGNFQMDNFGRGGEGNDPLQAEAQDGEFFANANFATPPDGLAPRMQMFIWTEPYPDRDGDLDAEVILHEYTHGLSNRRVGGGLGIGALSTRGMGEGWSDFYALALLSQASDDVDGTYPLAGYSSYLLGNAENYYYGIRRYPYCTDTNKNPLTFKDIDPTQISAHAGVPRNPRSAFNTNQASEVHAQGEVWCNTLWEIRANLIRKHGYPTGNQLTLQLVTDGMTLCPPNPNFLQSRDAIIQADFVNNGGANFRKIWAGFAKRGMGFSAL
ncbi:MAG TPA: M36 family metallopeptidase, partial [Verrucomicrobiae bacterium]|nr:M36 family metallopeptidase [Verrucomicrobiae bacterium]